MCEKKSVAGLFNRSDSCDHESRFAPQSFEASQSENTPELLYETSLENGEKDPDRRLIAEKTHPLRMVDRDLPRT